MDAGSHEGAASKWFQACGNPLEQGSSMASSSSVRRPLSVLLQPKPTMALPGCPQAQRFTLPVDEEAKATELRLASFSRPHMRAWHLSWACLFAAFLSTFSPAALMPLMREDLDLTMRDIAITNLASVAGAIPVRLLAGSLVDGVGPRAASGLLLLGTAPAVFCTALVAGPTGLTVVRLVGGISLGVFVVGQSWVRAMFSARCLGTASALSAGWGNAGGGVALLLMPALAHLLQRVLDGGLPWRVAMLVPGLLQLAVGIAVLLVGDDRPDAPEDTTASSVLPVQRPVRARHRPPSSPSSSAADVASSSSMSEDAVLHVEPLAHTLDATPAAAAAAVPCVNLSAADTLAAAPSPVGTGCHRWGLSMPSCSMGPALVPPVLPGGLAAAAGHSPLRCWATALGNYRTWLLGVAYALCFGVELVVNNVLVKYLYDAFALDLTTAGAIAGAAGLLNLFTRVAGGWASDVVARPWGMRGRCWTMWLLLVLGGMGSLLLGVCHGQLAASLVMLALFSAFMQAGCGAVFAVVPFVSVRANGLVTGTVAACGSLGALVLQLLFFGALDLPPWVGFYWMGVVVLVASAVAWGIYFPQWGGMCCRPRQGASEEVYYLGEFSAPERAAGAHYGSLAFAFEARANRPLAPPAPGLFARGSSPRGAAAGRV